MKKNKKVPTIEKVHFDVLKTDIVRGKRGNPYSCAVARAIARQGYKKVSVTMPVIVVSKGGITFMGKLPTRTKTWISKFDQIETGRARAKEMKPFGFEVLLTEVVA